MYATFNIPFLNNDVGTPTWLVSIMRGALLDHETRMILHP